jgi:hypothetical protein
MKSREIKQINTSANIQPWLIPYTGMLQSWWKKYKP